MKTESAGAVNKTAPPSRVTTCRSPTLRAGTIDDTMGYVMDRIIFLLTGRREIGLREITQPAGERQGCVYYYTLIRFSFDLDSGNSEIRIPAKINPLPMALCIVKASCRKTIPSVVATIGFNAQNIPARSAVVPLCATG